ncbi:MAG: transglutaminase domain-containing protein [Bacillota bacterium]
MAKTVTKKITMVVMIMILIGACSLLFTACDLFSSSSTVEVAVESVRVTDSIIYMSPTGDPATATIEASVYPSNATNQGLTYSLLDNADGQYVTVSGSGVLTAKAAKDDGAIIVRVFSHDDRNIYVDVTVYIEIVEVSYISFNVSSLTVTLEDENLVQVEPVFTPSHATIGRDVVYTVLNPVSYTDSVVTVDADGYITPLNIGVATIMVSTPAGELETDIFATIQVEVVYSDLAYIMTLGNDSDSVLKQIVGATETIEVNISALNSTCNQDPEITWYIDNTAQNGYNNSQTFYYDPTTLPYGEYIIKAILTDTDGTTLTLDIASYYGTNLMMYDPLLGIDLTLISGDATLEQGETAVVQVSFDASQYPPESYVWYLIGADGTETWIEETDTTTFSYYLATYGDDITLRCVPIIKGVNQVDLQKDITISSVVQTQTGTDIFDVFVDGITYLGETLAHVMWDAMPYDTSYIVYTVEVINTATNEAMYYTNTDYSEYFTINGFMIPSDFVTLEDSFTVRVKTNLYGYSEEVTYTASTIATEYYDYLDTLISGTHFNSYFVTMEELGEFINYLSLFRPEEISTEDNAFAFSFCTDMVYTEIENFSSYYPVGSATSSDNQTYINIYNLVVGAFTAYADTTSFSMNVDMSKTVPTVTIVFTSELGELVAVETEEDNTNAIIAAAYGDGSRTDSATLNIDNIEYTMSVSTSNQLYYAVAMGYQPVPVAGSAAETVYEAAREVLIRIIDDSMTDAEKILAIYDFLTLEVVYDYELAYASESNPLYEGFYLEGVFVNGIAVCDGIAKAFTLLTMMEGIKSDKVIGYETVSGVGHAWNMVVLDGEWYGVDATWGSVMITGSTEEVQTHYWLLTTDYIMSANHLTYGKYQATATTAANDVYYSSYTINTQTELNAYLATMVSDLTASGDDYIYVEYYFTESFYNSVIASGSFTSGVQAYIGEYLSANNNGTVGEYSVTGVSTDGQYLLIKLIAR